MEYLINSSLIPPPCSLVWSVAKHAYFQQVVLSLPTNSHHTSLLPSAASLSWGLARGHQRLLQIHKADNFRIPSVEGPGPCCPLIEAQILKLPRLGLSFDGDLRLTRTAFATRFLRVRQSCTRSKMSILYFPQVFSFFVNKTFKREKASHASSFYWGPASTVKYVSRDPCIGRCCTMHHTYSGTKVSDGLSVVSVHSLCIVFHCGMVFPIAGGLGCCGVLKLYNP